jgi:MFS family permease
MSSFYLLLSVVPMYATEHRIGSAGAGLSTGVLMFASVAAELVAPWLAARLGYRRLLVLGLILLGAPSLALPMVTGLAALMAVSVARGIGFAIVVVAVGAMTAMTVPEQRRGEGMGALGVVAMLPAILVLPLGVWLVDRVGYSPVFLIGAVVAVVGIPFVPTASSGVAAAVHRGPRPPILRPALAFAVTAVASGVVVAFLPGAVSVDIAVPALFAQSAAATLTRWLTGRYADRRGPAGLLAPAVIACAIGIGLAAATGSGAAVLAGMTVFGAGFGVAQSASMNLMLQRAHRSQYGIVNAAWNAAYDVGWGAGAIGIGFVVTGAGYSVAFAATAVLVLAAVPVAVRPGRARTDGQPSAG